MAGPDVDSSVGVEHASMANVSGSRHPRWFLFLILSLGQGPRLTHFATSWAFSWWTNRSSVLVFTTINAGITAGTEFISREMVGKHVRQQDRFIVRDQVGHVRVHRQSQQNILMSIFASLIGAPVYFFRSRKNRWAFFAGFGVFNSFLSQAVLMAVSVGRVGMDPWRILFDLVYAATLKFGMFELGRGTIVKLRHSKSVLRVGGVRIIQDLLMTTLRVMLLTLFRFKG